MIADVSGAFFEAPAKRDICVELPEEALVEGETVMDTLGKLMASLRQNTLTKEEAAKCEGDLTVSEVFAVMKNLPRNKATGPDGLPNEYYKTFATLEVTELTKVYNEAHNIGHLSAEMRQGNISLLYKKRNVTT